MMSKGTQWIAVDWDHTLFKTYEEIPTENAREFLDAIHDKGWKVIVHSCNNPSYIRQQCELHKLRVDAIWGEAGLEGAKPVCAAYLDDRAVGFRGDLMDSFTQIEALVEGRPIR